MKDLIGSVKSGLVRVGSAFSSVQLTLIQKIVLFILFTGILVFLTALALPKLVLLGPVGYLGGFVINGLSAATVIIPGPGVAAVIIMVKDLDPFLLGIASGIGGTIGELSGYWLGSQGREPLNEHRFYGYLQRSMSRFGGGIIFLFALIPLLPVDAAGIVAGATRYPIPKFLFYLGMGKVIMMVAILYLAARAFEWAEPYLSWLGYDSAMLVTTSRVWLSYPVRP